MQIQNICVRLHIHTVKNICICMRFSSIYSICQIFAVFFIFIQCTKMLHELKNPLQKKETYQTMYKS